MVARPQTTHQMKTKTKDPSGRLREMINLTVPPEIKEKAKCLAKAQGISTSKLFEMLILNCIDALQVATKSPQLSQK